MRTYHQLSAALLAATGLPVIYAWGPGGGQWSGRPSPINNPLPTTSTVAGQPSTPPASVSASVVPTSVGLDTTVLGAGPGQSTGTAVPPVSSTSAGTTPLSSQGSTPNSCDGNAQKISLQNNSGKNLVILAGAPWTVGSCGNIASGSSCTFCQTRGSTGGNLQVGYGVANPLGTWIEGEWNINTDPTIDISFIPGYSVPISCTSDSTGASKGWSTPLCSDSSCQNCVGDGVKWDGNACQNPTGPGNPNAGSLTNGPCPKFFSSSQNDAYCYPNDNGVVGYGPGWSAVSCTAGPQSGGGSTKREEGGLFLPRDVQEENLTLDARHAHAAALGSHGGVRAHARSLKHRIS